MSQIRGGGRCVARTAGALLVALLATAPVGWGLISQGFAAQPAQPVHPGAAIAPVVPDPSAAGSATHFDVFVSVATLAGLLLLARWYRGPSRLQWFIVGLSLFLSLRYLAWRGLYTLNTSDPLSLGLSLTVFAAEVYGVGATLLFYFQIINPIHRTSPTPDPERLPTVDVFVTVCDEPADILKRTLIACQALDYPADLKRIYVLDDGGRRDVREIAAALGCAYLNRPTREHAKAGNLNFALAHSSGEVIACFDTDHAPVRSFLMETVGFFEDSKVALVQTPHHFYNPDLFQRNLRMERRLVNEQDLFFQLVQPGRDGHNSVFFCGSGGLFRRRPLEEIGGFATKSVTEDIHTSILIHAKGHRSVYLNKRLAAGLSPESYASYQRQRQRWTRGHLQLLFSRESPLLLRGLTFVQRVDYLASIYYFLHGPARVIYLLGPLAYLLFGKYVVVADATALLTFYAAHYAGAVAASSAVTRGFRNPFWSDLYETVMSVPLTLTVMASVFLRRPPVFHITPKGVRAPRPSFHLLPSLPYMLLAGAMGWGIAAGVAEIVRWGRPSTAAAISAFWAGYNLLLCVAATAAARERPQRRAALRVARDMPCELRADHAFLPARTFDVSETGMRLVLHPPRFLPALTEVRLCDDGGEVTTVQGRVVRNDRVGDRDAVVGIAWVDVTDDLARRLVRHMYSAPSSWAIAPVADTRMWRSLGWLCAASLQPFAKERPLRRLAPRFTLKIPCEIVSRDEVVSGVTEDMSETGLLIRCPDASRTVAERCVVRLTPGVDLFTVRGRVIWRTARNGELYIGILCEEHLSRFLITWIEFVQSAPNRRRPMAYSEPTLTG